MLFAEQIQIILKTIEDARIHAMFATEHLSLSSQI
jgi:hypothetical protein